MEICILKGKVVFNFPPIDQQILFLIRNPEMFQTLRTGFYAIASVKNYFSHTK